MSIELDSTGVLFFEKKKTAEMKPAGGENLDI